LKGSGVAVGKINILIVDDSAFMRKLISDFLTEDSRMSVVGTARNGQDALKKIKELKPDVVTMDVEMPIMDGISALEQIMKENPVPVIMLSSTTKVGAENTIQAMQIGAIDFIAKPSGAISLDLYKVKEELIEKVISASKVKLSKLLPPQVQEKSSIINRPTYSRIEPKEVMPVKPIKPTDPSWNAAANKLVVLGTSTGGPRALQHVITKLPANINAPILIVQHMPAGFTQSLANRLNSLSEITVKEAEHGETIHKGVAYIAPGGYHLKVKSSGNSLVVHLDQSAPVNGHRPSVDVMFESASELETYHKLAVIMTGMGSDGTNGLIKLVNKGKVKSIAESKETSIVFGMPKAAIATNYVNEIQNVENIAQTIMKYV